MENFLMDTALNKNYVLDLLILVKEMMKTNIKNAAGWKADGICIYEDWGTQTALLISPKAWREIFKPVYKEIMDYTHSLGMKFFMHSCGYVYEIIGDLIEVGVDVFQFDQPQLVGVDKLAGEFGGKVTFWCPVDIQKIMATGNKELIEADARKMLKVFKKFKGGFIAKDYPDWEDINVKPEWAKWARDIFLNEGSMIDWEKN
jgi:uroporphyrinogen-III decarboxylase